MCGSCQSAAATSGADRTATRILKTPLGTLQQLRAVIEDIKRRADEVAAVVAMVTKPEGETTH